MTTREQLKPTRANSRDVWPSGGAGQLLWPARH